MGAWQFGDFTFEPISRRLKTVTGEERLTVKGAAVLEILLHSAQSVVLRDHLIRQVWNGNDYSGPKALTYTIWQLRRALDQSAGRESPAAGNRAPEEESGVIGPIETVARTGYCLTLPATFVSTRESRRPAVSTVRDETVPGFRAVQRWGGWLLATTVVLLLVMLGIHVWPRPHAVLQYPATHPLTLLDGLEDFPAFAPDGKRWAFIWTRDGQPSRLRIADFSDPDRSLLDLVDANASIERPVWLDNDHIAYVRLQPGQCQVVIAELSSGDRHQVASCHSESLVPVLSGSPDGQWLVIAQVRGDGNTVGLTLHRVADGFERMLTTPPAGFWDTAMAWSFDGRRIAVLRVDDTGGDVYVVDVDSGRLHQLTHERSPLFGVAWLQHDQGIVFSGAMHGRFGVWKISPKGGEPTLFAPLESARAPVAIADGSGDIAVSLYRFADHIEVIDPVTSQVTRTIASSSRDMYAQACPDSGHVVFVSMRSGSVALWAQDGPESEAHQIGLPPGVPEPPNCDPDSGRFATVVSGPGGTPDRIVVGQPSGNEPARVVFSDGSNLSFATWAEHGRALLVSSDRGGDWALWKLDLESRRMTRLTQSRSGYAHLVRVDGKVWLYYNVTGHDGLLRRDPEQVDASAQTVLPALASEDFGNWLWHDGALWFVARSADADQVIRQDADGSRHVVLSRPVNSISRYEALSVGADGRLLLSVTGPRQADIVRVSPPRS